VACNVIALCSLTETLSLAAIESMALSRPVVHSNVGGASEMIRPGWNGFLFPVGDTQALVATLGMLVDPNLAKRMGDQARQTVETLFSEEVMVDRYEKMLHEVCAKGVHV
jgi:glycosyltransferase involved in cell wall biosynthesis